MSFFRGQLSNVVEWEEFRDDMIFWKWGNSEIKKGSKLILRTGQDAIFFNNGKIEGVFTDAGDYNIESEIIPFLSTLKGFKFGFNSGMRVEVLFVNTKVFQVKWGTRNAINIPSQQLPGGIPIRANGTFSFKVSDYMALIENIVGIKDKYLVEDVRTRISANLDQLLMKWITREGKDMFNLQANAFEIAQGIKEDLDMQVLGNGMSIQEFNIRSFTYPKEIQEMITKSASQGMLGDVDKYQRLAMTDAMAESMKSGKGGGGGNAMSGTATDMAGMMMGMNMANEMMKGMNPNQNQNQHYQQHPNQNNQFSGNPNQQQFQGQQGYQGQPPSHPQQGQGGQQWNQSQQHQQSQPQSSPSEQGNGNSGASPASDDGAKSIPNFCPNCGSKTAGMNFCGNCGHKLA